MAATTTQAATRISSARSVESSADGTRGGRCASDRWRNPNFAVRASAKNCNAPKWRANGAWPLHLWGECGATCGGCDEVGHDGGGYAATVCALCE